MAENGYKNFDLNYIAYFTKEWKRLQRALIGHDTSKIKIGCVDKEHQAEVERYTNV